MATTQYNVEKFIQDVNSFHHYDELPMLHNSTTSAPGVGDDSADGYQVGSTWYNSTTGIIYTCTDNTAGAAVWVTQSHTGLTDIGTNTHAQIDTALTNLSNRIKQQAIWEGF